MLRGQTGISQSENATVDAITLGVSLLPVSTRRKNDWLPSWTSASKVMPYPVALTEAMWSDDDDDRSWRRRRRILFLLEVNADSVELICINAANKTTRTVREFISFSLHFFWISSVSKESTCGLNRSGVRFLLTSIINKRVLRYYIYLSFLLRHTTYVYRSIADTKLRKALNRRSSLRTNISYLFAE
jgi:hypothetical protein